MNILKHFTRTVGYFLLSFVLFLSCDNNRRTSGITEKTEETADTFEGPEADLERKRERLAFYIQNQISRNQSQLDSLRQELTSVTIEEEKKQIIVEIERLESEIDNLEQQQNNLAQANLGEFEQIERNIQDILHDYVETHVLDRGVRGEGTSLDGPDFNRTGTRTGTEVDSDIPEEVEEAEAQRPSVPSDP
jgi:DNA repair exonuclease SbcCD ATPase subunit